MAYHIYIVRWDGKEKVFALDTEAKTFAINMRAIFGSARLFRRRVSMEEYGRLVRKNVVYGVSYTAPPRPYVPWNTPERGSL